MAEHTVYAVASGKGGVGKTTTTVNLGTALAQQGHSVALVDADLGMANLGGYLGVGEEGRTLHEVLAGEAELEAAVYEVQENLAVVPSGISLKGFANVETAALSDAVDALEGAFDYVLLDIGAGLSHDSVLPLALADAVLLVSTPDPLALTDTAKTREVTERLGGAVAGTVITRAKVADGFDVDAVEEQIGIPVLSVVPDDDLVHESAEAGRPIVGVEPDSPVAEAYRGLADIVVEESLANAPVVPEVAEPELELDADPTPEAGSEPDPAPEAESDAGSEPQPASTAEGGADPEPGVQGDPAAEPDAGAAGDPGPDHRQPSGDAEPSPEEPTVGAGESPETHGETGAAAPDADRSTQSGEPPAHDRQPPSEGDQQRPPESGRSAGRDDRSPEPAQGRADEDQQRRAGDERDLVPETETERTAEEIAAAIEDAADEGDDDAALTFEGEPDTDSRPAEDGLRFDETDDGDAGDPAESRPKEGPEEGPPYDGADAAEGVEEPVFAVEGAEPDDDEDEDEDDDGLLSRLFGG
jgi:septum site-determining protein MinD